MKRLITAIFAVALIGLVFSSCKKDDSSASTNSVTIMGEFTIGDKTYTNPTFDLGAPSDNEGFLANYGKSITYNTIVSENDIDLGQNVYLYYDLEIYSAVPGTEVGMYVRIEVYQDIPLKTTTSLYIYSQDAKATITSVGEVGGYIEGTYEGDFYYDTKKVEAPFHVIGKFKILRTDTPVK